MSVLIVDLGVIGTDGVSIQLDPKLAAVEFITKAGLNLTTEIQNLNPTLFSELNALCIEETSGATICSNYNYQAAVDGYKASRATRSCSLAMMPSSRVCRADAGWQAHLTTGEHGASLSFCPSPAGAGWLSSGHGRGLQSPAACNRNMPCASL